MAIPKVTQPTAVLAAIDEYDTLGGRAFHEKYGFGPADEYLVSARGRLYDSKAILAAAQGYEDPGLGPARNKFSGGGQVQRRLERLGFDVIVDRRSGDFLKLLPAMRVAHDGGAERVYKPLLLLVALGRSASGEPRLAPFGTYEEALEPLLERFSEGHGEAAVQNAWWRLPGDKLWEVRSDSGAVIRAAGERATKGPPAISELRSQTGGVPERFHDALREVPALPATAANVLVERFFGDRTPEEKESLIDLASVSDAMGVVQIPGLTVLGWSPVVLSDVVAWITAAGLALAPETVRRYHLSLQTRGFVILAGVSGSGKSWLAEAYADAVAGEKLVVAVAPNWTTNEDLLGYLNPLDNHYYDTDFSLFLRAAAREWKQAAADGRTPVPYYLVLDEMNLARVEYYFAKFLSAMERRARDEEAVLELSPREQDHVLLAPNLFVTGTVNIDETTFGFADKVYDRAQLLEIPVSRDAL